MSLSDFYTDKTILLTGATGFLGKYFLCLKLHANTPALHFNRQGRIGEDLPIPTRSQDHISFRPAAGK